MEGVPPASVLFEDQWLFALNKPSGLLTHPSPLCPDRDTALSRGEAAAGCKLYTGHRLDRATSGVLLFSKDPESARAITAAFTEHQVRKRYIAIVRGWPADEGVVDRPLIDPDGYGNGNERPAVTRYRTLARAELPIVVHPRYPAARYALVALEPLTGRPHQIRRHMRGIDHPLIGDTSYGNGMHNRFFRSHFNMRRLFLHAISLEIAHPHTSMLLRVAAPLCEDFISINKDLFPGVELSMTL